MSDAADHIGPYEIRGELGRGAMAIVWRGYDSKLEREVAIKEPVLAAGTQGQTPADASARFVREGKAAAQLNHPGIVTIYAADVFDGRPAIVMELIEGETLSSILDRGVLPPTAAVAIADQLLDAIAYAHDHDVVHRDIKPDNVFVTPEGRVKLADFGIAHVGTGAALTQAGTIVGTPGYMAPEQITGDPVDGRADIFAVGAVAYEMLSGCNPFGATDGTAPTTVMYRIVHEQPPTLPEGALSELPIAIAPILGAALAKDPADRFTDAKAFRNALAGAPILTGRSGTANASVVVMQSAWGSPAVATSVAKPTSAVPTWTPYAIVGAIAVLILGGLFLLAGGSLSSGSGGAKPTVATVAVDPTDADVAVINERLEGWRSTWEAMDLRNYMAFYAPDFRSNYTANKNLTQWEAHKRKLFKERWSQKIAVSDVQTEVTGDNATSTFHQAFSADLKTRKPYSDNGIKTLTWRREGSTWLIVGEEM